MFLAQLQESAKFHRHVPGNPGASVTECGRECKSASDERLFMYSEISLIHSIIAHFKKSIQIQNFSSIYKIADACL